MEKTTKSECECAEFSINRNKSCIHIERFNSGHVAPVVRLLSRALQKYGAKHDRYTQMHDFNLEQITALVVKNKKKVS